MAAKEKKTSTTSVPPDTAATKPTTRRATTKRKAAPTLTEEMIAERAYLISQSSECASDVENWLRAEAELKSA